MLYLSVLLSLVWWCVPVWLHSSLYPGRTTSRGRKGQSSVLYHVKVQRTPSREASHRKLCITPDCFTWPFLTRSMARERGPSWFGVDQSEPTVRVWGCPHFSDAHGCLHAWTKCCFRKGRRRGGCWMYSQQHCLRRIVDGTCNHIISFSMYFSILFWLCSKSFHSLRKIVNINNILLSSFYEASITLIPEPHKDSWS